MAHRGPMRELFGMLCMALMVEKSEKMAPLTGNTGYIIETVNAVEDYIKHPNVTTILPTAMPRSTGYSSYIVSFLAFVFSYLGEEVIIPILCSLLFAALLSLLRIAKPWFQKFGTCAYQRVRGLVFGGRVAGGDATDNTDPTADEVDESHQSRPQGTTTAIPDDSDDNWFDAEESQPSSAEIPQNAPVPPTNEQVSANLQAQLGRKDKRIATLFKVARNMSKEIVNIKGRKGQLMLHRRRTLKGSNAHQDNKQLMQKVAEIARLTAENTRLEFRVLSLKRARKSSGLEVQRIKEEAQERMRELKEQHRAAAREKLDVATQRDYDNLRRHFDEILGERDQAIEERQEAMKKLQAERVRTEAGAQRQSETSDTATTDQLQLAREGRLARLEQQAVAKDEEVLRAKTRAQESESRVQEAEAKAQEAETRAQGAGIRAQEAESRSQNAMERCVTFQQDLNAARDSEKELRDSNEQLKQSLQRAEEALAKVGNDAQVAVIRDSPSASQEDACTQTEQAEEDGLYQRGFQAAAAEAEAMLVNAQQERQRMKEQYDSALFDQRMGFIGQFNTEVENTVMERERPLRVERDTALQRATTAEIQANNTNAELTKALNSLNIMRLNVERFDAADERKVAEKARGDRLRAHAIVEEFIHRSYDWDTRAVLTKLLNANEKLVKFEELLMDPKTQPDQIEFLKALLDAEVDAEMYAKLDQPNRQVLVKQCRAVNVRLNDLKAIINANQQPSKEELLKELYKPRGDELARFNSDDPEPEPSSDEDDEEPRSRNPASRQVRIPTSRKVPTSTSQQQSNDQTDISSQSPGITSPPAQPSTSSEPTAPSETLPRVEHAPHPKPTKIPVPKPKPHLSASERQQRLRYIQYPDSEAESAQETAASSSIPATAPFTFHLPKNIATAVVDPAPATPAKSNQTPIFKGLSLLGAAMADKTWMTDKKAALPGLPAPEDDQVLEFESSAGAEDHDSDREPEDRFLLHSASDDVDDEEEIAWEKALYASDSEQEENLNIELDTHTSLESANSRHPNDHQTTPNWLNDQDGPVRALDMTEQNYEDQAAEFAAANAQGGTRQAPPSTSHSELPQGGKEEEEEELEDNFHIDLE